jgi:hypothetical protein
MGLENFLGSPDGLLGDVGQVETHFRPFGDSINLVVHGFCEMFYRL